MSGHRNTDGRDHGRNATEAAASADGSGERRELSVKADERPRLQVRAIGRVTIIRFEDAEILFEESAVRAVRNRLNHLIEEGHTRLLVNFGGVQYVSCAVLGVLASLQKKGEPARGCIQLCGLDPLLRDMLRIAHLDRVFDVFDDEAEALGPLYNS